jgi:hypothetical protein
VQNKIFKKFGAKGKILIVDEKTTRDKIKVSPIKYETTKTYI